MNDIDKKEFSLECILLAANVWLSKVSQPEKCWIPNPNWVEPSEAEKEAYKNMFKCINVGPEPIKQ